MMLKIPAYCFAMSPDKSLVGSTLPPSKGKPSVERRKSYKGVGITWLVVQAERYWKGNAALSHLSAQPVLVQTVSL